MRSTLSLVFVMSLSLSSLAAETTVTGRITGASGTPIPLANVSLIEPNMKAPQKIIEADKYGEYEITIDSRGVWLLRFSGVFHQDYTIAVYVDNSKKIGLDVRLATYKYGKSFGEVKVLGNFNRWYPPSAAVMQKHPSGTYSAEIRTNVNPVLYQLTGVLGRTIPGTEAERYTYDQNVGYSAVLNAAHGKVRITFDPAKLLTSEEPTSFTFSRADSVESRFAKAYDEMQKWDAQYNDAFMRSIGKPRSEKKAVEFDFMPVFSTIENQLRSEQSEIVRQELHLINFLFLSKKEAVNTSVAKDILEEVPPGSPVWSLAPLAISDAFDRSGYDNPQRRRYVEEVIKYNPSGPTISALLSNEFMIELYRGDRAQAMRYYDVAVNQYGDTPGGEKIAQYHNVSAVDSGKRAPDFSVGLIRTPPKVVTNKYFEGKYYLVCFWSTQNEPSVEEIKLMKKAYAEFRLKGLAVLTLSLDSSRQVVEEFEKTSGKLAWFNAIVPKGFGSKICKDYEVFAVPKPILIDPHGKIIAVGLDLRGDKLKNTLTKFLGRKK